MSASGTIYHGTIQPTITIKMTTIMLIKTFDDEVLSTFFLLLLIIIITITMIITIIKTFDDEVLSTSFLLLLSRGSGFALTGGFGSQAARRSRTW